VKVPRTERGVKNGLSLGHRVSSDGIHGFGEEAQTLGIFDIAVQIVELLAIDLGFGEGDVPFMALFFHFVPFFLALGALLRFEANFGFALGGS